MQVFKAVTRSFILKSWFVRNLISRFHDTGIRDDPQRSKQRTLEAGVFWIQLGREVVEEFPGDPPSSFKRNAAEKNRKDGDARDS